MQKIWHWAGGRGKVHVSAAKPSVNWTLDVLVPKMPAAVSHLAAGDTNGLTEGMDFLLGLFSIPILPPCLLWFWNPYSFCHANTLSFCLRVFSGSADTAPLLWPVLCQPVLGGLASSETPPPMTDGGPWRDPAGPPHLLGLQFPQQLWALLGNTQSIGFPPFLSPTTPTQVCVELTSQINPLISTVSASVSGRNPTLT